MFENYCIVGNAPCEMGKGEGKKIDEYQNIFRFNNFKLEGFEMDYGSRTTHWVCNFANDIQIRPFNEETTILCPLPLDHKVHLDRYNSTNKYHLYANYNRIEFIPVNVFEELKKHIVNPSSGIALLYWIYKETGKLETGRIKGFSFFNTLEAHHYFDTFDKCGHDGQDELELFKMMLNGRA